MNTQLSKTLTQQALEARRDSSAPGEHYMEAVAEIGGVLYVNDSKATSVQDTRASLRSVETNNIVLITGGDDHRNDYASLVDLIDTKVKMVIYLGADNDRLLKHVSKSELLFTAAASVEEAVEHASRFVKVGDMVLFSPACPSFDPFDNYKNRGNKFKKIVNKLIPEN